VMSTVDSGLNSLSTCTVTDFYARLIHPSAPESRKLHVAKILTFAWGAVSILCAGAIMWLFGIERERNPMVVVTTVTIGFFTGILLGVVLLGVMTRRANATGALIGATIGLGAVLGVTAPYYFRELSPGTPRLSFLWINIIGCVVTVIVGYAASLFRPAPDAGSIRGWTYWTRRENTCDKAP